MKELSRSPLGPLVFACAALFAGYRSVQQHPALTIPISNTGGPVGSRDVSRLPGTVFQGTTAESFKLNLNEVKKTTREPDIDACGAK